MAHPVRYLTRQPTRGLYLRLYARLNVFRNGCSAPGERERQTLTNSTYTGGGGWGCGTMPEHDRTSSPARHQDASSRHLLDDLPAAIACFRRDPILSHCPSVTTDGAPGRTIRSEAFMHTQQHNTRLRHIVCKSCVTYPKNGLLCVSPPAPEGGLKEKSAGAERRITWTPPDGGQRGMVSEKPRVEARLDGLLNVSCICVFFRVSAVTFVIF